MTESRVDPPYQADERTMLTAWLEYHRATLLFKCEGLSHDQLRQRSAPPSSLSLLGLVRHMADVERGWFQQGVAQETVPSLWETEDDRDADFNGVDTADVDEAFSAFNEEVEKARAIVTASPSLDTTFPLTRRSGERTDISLRWVLVHMVEEYARHNGHADILRERIDGATGS